MEPFMLTEKTALITGAAQGIGFSSARSLAMRGASVGIVDLNGAEAAAAALSEEFPQQRFAGLGLDVRDSGAVDDCVRGFVERFGQLDVLVCNAGTAARVTLDGITPEQWQLDLDTNLGGTFNFIRAAVHPHMLEAGGGSIVTISSISGINGGAVSGDGEGGRSGPAYAASKGGIIALTKWVAKEYGRSGIRCNSVAPGPVESALTKGQPYDTSGQAIDRLGVPEEIAETVAYLASDGASFTTGQIIRVDGGAVMS